VSQISNQTLKPAFRRGLNNVKSESNLARMYDHARVYLELQHLRPEPGHVWSRPVEIYYDPGFDFYTTEERDVALKVQTNASGVVTIVIPYASEERDVVFKDQTNASGVVTNIILLKFQRDATGAITNTIQDASSLVHHQPSLNLQMRDGNDKPYPNEITTINGSDPAPCWVTLPCDATLRLRADIYNLLNSKKPNGLEILVNGGGCTIPPHATNDYYLCGTFSPPTNHPSPLNYHVWQGTLNLPRVKIPSR
jgi:hypothetical protein